MVTSDIVNAAWSLDRVESLGAHMANKIHQSVNNCLTTQHPNSTLSTLNTNHVHTLEEIASFHGIEAVYVDIGYANIDRFLQLSAPAIIKIELNGEMALLGILGKSYGRFLRCLTPDLSVVQVSIKTVRDLLCSESEGSIVTHMETLLSGLALPKHKTKRVTATMSQQLLSGTRLTAGWMLRLPPSASFYYQLKENNLINRLLTSITMHMIALILMILAWFTIGQSTLTQQFDQGWLIAWSLIIFSYILFSILEMWLQSRFSCGFSILLKRRLMHGALNIDENRLSGQGIGQLLGRVMESDSLESGFLNGAFNALFGIIDLIVAFIVLNQATAGLTLSIALIIFTILIICFSAIYFHRYSIWTRGRINLTNIIIERMNGHRTRTVQSSPENFNEGEDLLVDNNLRFSRNMDQSIIWIQTILPRAWLIISMSLIFFGLFSTSTTLGSMAIAIGGILLASGALQRITQSLGHFASAWVAWQQVHELFVTNTPKNETHPPRSFPTSNNNQPTTHSTIISAKELSFQYPSHNPLLRDINLSILQGDQILLEGPSGSGKSTLSALLMGELNSTTGVIFNRGLDLDTLGTSNWRKSIKSAPQFHRNHIFSGSLAFNCLMGRQWPATDEDLEEMEQVCRELGLGEVIDRMPSGVQQLIGDSGWQLSHGEKSRIFIARTLLQEADLVILDESFAALDPITLSKALTYVRKRLKTLLVIAHP